ncbi:hypothetical protein [Pararhodobacter oceanensis]|uniref:hypothetical protein n=1 Tax=Pararhodobacter oceanensis TaxID=2172121 RepID=UPI003A951EB9
MSTSPSGWEGILDQGEEILWQGQPDDAIIWTDLISPQTFMGLFFCGFSAFWLTGVWAILGSMDQAGALGLMFLLFPIVGVIFFGTGLYMLGGRLFWDVYLRQNTWYTLTTEAAYIATAPLGKRRLKRYAYSEMSQLSLDDGQPGTIWFAEELRSYRSHSKSGRGRTRTARIPIGFRRIGDARAVYRLLRDHRDQSTSASAPTP